MKVFRIEIGGVAEWLKAADCKSARVSVRRFESYPHHHCRQMGRDHGWHAVIRDINSTGPC